MARDPLSGQDVPEHRDPVDEVRGSGVYPAPPRYSGPERRTGGESDGPFAGLPQWARVIALVGIPGAIALFLVWVGSQSLPKLEAELTAMRLESEKNRLVVQQQVTQTEQVYRILQRICSSLAKSDEERGRCFDR